MRDGQTVIIHAYENFIVAALPEYLDDTHITVLKY